MEKRPPVNPSTVEVLAPYVVNGRMKFAIEDVETVETIPFVPT